MFLIGNWTEEIGGTFSGSRAAIALLCTMDGKQIFAY